MNESDEKEMNDEMENTADATTVEPAENGSSAADDSGEANESLEDLLGQAQKEAAKNLEGWQRALADLSNARKRFDKQTKMAYTNATVDVVSKLLPVIDDLDRAMENVPPEIAEHGWFDGLGGVRRKLNNILESINVERIPAVGEPFDPNVHEALTLEPSDEYESETVTRELQAGYRLGDRVVRPALVYVAE